MDTETCSIYELFEQSKRHVVPLYQRPYVWNEDDQWAPLWEDVREKTDAIRANRSTPAHFLGAVVRSQAPAPGLKLDVRLVIDGQQRLTTFQVLLATIRDLIHERLGAANVDDVREALDDLETDFEKVTKNEGKVKEEIERFKVYPTQGDRAAFTEVMGAGSRANLDTRFPITVVRKKRIADPRPLVEAYRFFHDQVREYVVSPGEPTVEEAHAFEALLQCFREKLQIVVIDLDADDDPQVIFETLNDRGAPLLASDLIKNFVFGRAVGQSVDADAAYEKHWRAFDEADDGTVSFWKTSIRQGRFTRPVFDSFLEHYVLSKTNGEFFLARHLYQEFKSWWQTDKDRSVIGFLDDLSRNSAVYRSFYEPVRSSESTRMRAFLSRLRVLDTTTAYPFLLFLIAQKSSVLTSAQRDAIVSDLESYLVRRAVCNKQTKTYTRVFSAVMRAAEKEQLTPETFRERLRALGGLDAWPTDDEFQSAWLRDAIYTRLKSPGVQMILRAIHDAMITNRQEPITIPETLTVEHILPQTWQTHWAPPDPLLASEEESAVERRGRLLHTLGNLTLLTGPLNAEVSNGLFGAKRDAIKQSVLVLNRYFDSAQDWNEDAIVERGKLLFSYALKIWPRGAP